MSGRPGPALTSVRNQTSHLNSSTVRGDWRWDAFIVCQRLEDLDNLLCSVTDAIKQAILKSGYDADMSGALERVRVLHPGSCSRTPTRRGSPNFCHSLVLSTKNDPFLVTKRLTEGRPFADPVWVEALRAAAVSGFELPELELQCCPLVFQETLTADHR